MLTLSKNTVTSKLNLENEPPNRSFYLKLFLLIHLRLRKKQNKIGVVVRPQG